MAQVDPDQFIITRKRKKYKFALFANSPICFEFDEWRKRHIDTVEIGAGTGLFSVELARKHPQKVFLAIDVKADRLQKGARRAEELGLANIFFLRARADQLAEIVEPKSLSSIWITFPDPHPKKRSGGRRLTHPTFIEIYKKALKPNSSILLKHDDLEFFCWSLEQMVENGVTIRELSFDLHDSSRYTEARIMTTYEKKWVMHEKKINYVRGEV